MNDMNDGRRNGGYYSRLTGIRRAVPILLAALAVFVAICFFTKGTGFLGNGITAVLLGLFSYGAYAIPLLIALHALFYAEDVAKRLTVSRFIFSLVTVLIVSTVQYAITFWGQEPIFDPNGFYTAQTAGGYIGSIIAFGIIKVLGPVGLVILCAAVLAIYLVFFFAKGDSSLSKFILSVLGVITGMLAVVEKEIKHAISSAKQAKEDKQKRDSEKRSAELMDDQFFAVDNGMKELTISELGIHEARGDVAIEMNPTLQTKVFPKSAVEEVEPAPAQEEPIAEITDKKHTVNSTYGLDEEMLHHDLPEMEEIVEETDEQTNSEEIEEPVRVEAKTVTENYGIDEKADSVFTREFDPFDFATAQKLASKPSSKVVPKDEYDGINEMSKPLSAITEEDLIRAKKREEDAARLAQLEKRRAAFEERKKAVIGNSYTPAAPAVKKEIDLSVPVAAAPMTQSEPRPAQGTVSAQQSDDALPSKSGFKIEENGVTVTYGKPLGSNDESEMAAAKIASIVAKNNPAYMRSANESYTVMTVSDPNGDIFPTEKQEPEEEVKEVVESTVAEAPVMAAAEEKTEEPFVTEFVFNDVTEEVNAEATEATVAVEEKADTEFEATSDTQSPIQEKTTAAEKPAVTEDVQPKTYTMPSDDGITVSGAHETEDGFIIAELTPIDASANEPKTVNIAAYSAADSTSTVTAPATDYTVLTPEEPVETVVAPEEPAEAEAVAAETVIGSPAVEDPIAEEILNVEVESAADETDANTAVAEDIANNTNEENLFKPYTPPTQQIEMPVEPVANAEEVMVMERTMLSPATQITEPTRSTYEVERDKRFTVIGETMPVYEEKTVEPEVPEDTMNWSVDQTDADDEDLQVTVTESEEGTVFDFGSDDVVEDTEVEEDGDDFDQIFPPEDEPDDEEDIPPEEQNPDVLEQQKMFPSIFGNGSEEVEDDPREPLDPIYAYVPDDEEASQPDEPSEDEPEAFEDEDEDEDGEQDDDEPPFDVDIPARTAPSFLDGLVEKSQKKEKEEEKPAPPKPDYSNYEFPSIELLGKDFVIEDEDTQYEIQENADKLIDTLASFNVTASIKGVDRGPRITRYEVVPAKGVKVGSVMNLQDDIALNLAAAGIRMEAPIPGKSAIGVEIPNKNSATVHLRDLLESEEFTAQKSKTAVCIGKDVAGCPVFGDIAKMPHLLIAGATGMGKSVCINSLMISMLYKARPDEVKFIMIDPKQVEFTMYNGIPHLLVPVVSDSKQAAGALMWAKEQMEKRYELIKNMMVRNIDAYNAKIAEDPSLGEPMSRIVIVIDEFADLMLQVRDPVENLVMSIAQKARAAGIHLIIGTQRPSVNVITGTIKANVPSRMSCKVASQVDSRTILETAGAEKLLDKGDMLFSFAGAVKPIRVQGAFVSDKEVEDVMKHLKQFSDGNSYDSSVMEEIERAAQKCSKKGNGGDDDDERDGSSGEGYLNDRQFLDAVEVAVNQGKISTSLLQRRLSIGYGKAAKYIDVMCDMGIVGESNGQRPRDVLISPDEWREKLARITLD